MDEHEELLGADYAEHNIHHPDVGVTRAVSVMKRWDSHHDLGLIPVGKNKGTYTNIPESKTRNCDPYIFASFSKNRSRKFCTTLWLSTNVTRKILIH